MNNSINQLPLISLILLFILFQFALSHTYKCHHDKLDHSLDVSHDLAESQDGRMLQDGYQNIRIYSDFTYLNNVDDSLQSYIQNELLPAAINYYSQLLKVIPLDKKLTSKKSQICNLPTPAIFSNEGVDADLALIVDASHEDSEYIAYARACVISHSNNRPVFGNIHFNLNYVQLGDENQHQQNLLITIHEMAHILGISKGLFEFYYDTAAGKVKTGHVKQKIVNGIDSFLVDVEPLTSKLQAFYGCTEIDGVLLENEGPQESAKSHFERRVFFNEIMTASSIENVKITEFMLAFLEGTGWYKGDYSMTEKMYWGKGKGCSFYFGPCVNRTSQLPNFDEFCSGLTQIGCDSSRRYGASCGGSSVKKLEAGVDSSFNYWTDNSAVSDMFADNCPYFIANDKIDCQDPFQQTKAVLDGEVYGQESKCFTGNLANQATTTQKKVNYCLKASCQKQADSSYAMVIKLGETTATCTAAGSISIPGYSGQLDCPDPNSYCSTYGQETCPRGCMGRGECVSNKCKCKDGWGGQDCSVKVYNEKCDRCKNNPLMTTCYGDDCGCMPNDKKCLCPNETDCTVEEAFNQAQRDALSSQQLISQLAANEKAYQEDEGNEDDDGNLGNHMSNDASKLNIGLVLIIGAIYLGI